MILPTDIAPVVIEKDYNKYESKYLPADEFIYFNEEDDVLKTIKVALPKPPSVRTMDGYGLSAKKQFFTVPTMPSRLAKLEKNTPYIKDIWDILNKHREDYEEEWQWIKEQWDRRINGYWFLLNGKPTYIDGWQYVYCSFWKLDVGLPDYRSRDRKFFLFARYCYTTTDAYYSWAVKDKKKGKIVKYFSSKTAAKRWITKQGVNGSYKLLEGNYFIDMKRRVCYGFNYPKHRREGATYKADLINYLITTGNNNVVGGIQSMDGESAKKAFLKAIVKPWRKMPFIFKPRFDGSTSPKSELQFDEPAQRIGGKGSLSTIYTGLESHINFATTANRDFYDGDKLAVLHIDECGKTTSEDVNERWQVQKKCLAQGNGAYIKGLALGTSTVGEMSEKGGMAFKRLCTLSMFDERTSTGQTTSGLYNLFIPAYDGLEGFIDIFGESIIEDPKEYEVWRIADPYRNSEGKLIGAKTFLNTTRDDLLMRDDEKSMQEYEEEVRLHPFKFSECFITAGSGSGLNLKKIVRRIKELEFDQTVTQRGNFDWKGGIRDTEVVWIPDDINGRWIISLVLSPAEANKKFSTVVTDEFGEDKLVYAPMAGWRFTAGSDPYKFRKVAGKRMSKGGGSVFMERDRMVDPDSKPLELWETYRNVCTYSYRPFDPEDYAEDMLMMSVYYGAMMFPEIDVPLVWDYFVKRHYDGFLKYQIDAKGNLKATPGYNVRAGSAQKVMQKHQQYIERHAHRERHIEILLECKSIKGVEDITNYDLFAAVGAAYVGSETDYSRFNYGESNSNDSDVSDYY